MKRSSGILMAISSLPSPYGIGTLGQAAYDFADFLQAAGQRYWQMLPLGPTSYGDSPYQSFSAYAGNPYFIDPELLIADGLLTKSECSRCKWGGDARHVDYGRIYEKRFDLLHKAFQRGWKRDSEAVAAFAAANARWLPDYALFMACKRHFGMKAWTEWPDDIRLRQEGAPEKYRALLQEDVDFFTYLQYLFFQQWDRLRDYVHGLNIRIIGDLPIYVAMDSADVWAETEFFQLDDTLIPKAVSGVPPDYFSADGQLWGNPLYNWDACARTASAGGYAASTAAASCSMSSASTTSAASTATGRCPTARPRPRTANGSRARAWIWWAVSTVGSPSWSSSPRIWATPPPASSSCCTNPVGPG